MANTSNPDSEFQESGSNTARQTPAPTSDSFRQVPENGSGNRQNEEGSRTDPVIINRIE